MGKQYCNWCVVWVQIIRKGAQIVFCTICVYSCDSLFGYTLFEKVYFAMCFGCMMDFELYIKMHYKNVC